MNNKINLRRNLIYIPQTQTMPIYNSDQPVLNWPTHKQTTKIVNMNDTSAYYNIPLPLETIDEVPQVPQKNSFYERNESNNTIYRNDFSNHSFNRVSRQSVINHNLHYLNKTIDTVPKNSGGKKYHPYDPLTLKQREQELNNSLYQTNSSSSHKPQRTPENNLYFDNRNINSFLTENSPSQMSNFNFNLQSNTIDVCQKNDDLSNEDSVQIPLFHFNKNQHRSNSRDLVKSRQSRGVENSQILSDIYNYNNINNYNRSNNFVKLKIGSAEPNLKNQIQRNTLQQGIQNQSLSPSPHPSHLNAIQQLESRKSKNFNVRNKVSSILEMQRLPKPGVFRNTRNFIPQNDTPTVTGSRSIMEQRAFSFQVAVSNIGSSRNKNEEEKDQVQNDQEGENSQKVNLDDYVHQSKIKNQYFFDVIGKKEIEPENKARPSSTSCQQREKSLNLDMIQSKGFESQTHYHFYNNSKFRENILYHRQIIKKDKLQDLYSVVEGEGKADKNFRFEDSSLKGFLYSVGGGGAGSGISNSKLNIRECNTQLTQNKEGELDLDSYLKQYEQRTISLINEKKQNELKMMKCNFNFIEEVDDSIKNCVNLPYYFVERISKFSDKVKSGILQKGPLTTGTDCQKTE